MAMSGGIWGRARATRAWSLQTHFLLFGAIVVLPLAALAAFLLYQLADRDRAQLEQRMAATAVGVAAHIDRDLGRRITVLQTLATSPSLSSEDFAAFHAQAGAVAQQDGTGIFLIDRSLQQILNTHVPFGTGLPAYGAPATAQRAFELKAPQISGFFIGRVTQRPAFDIDIPVIRKGEAQYVLAMGLEPSALQQILRSQEFPPEWIISVADTAGVVLARSHDQDKHVGTRLPDAVSGQRPGSASPAVTLDGSTMLRATSSSALAGWQVAVNFPMATAAAALRTNMLLLGLWGAVAMVLTVVMAAWFSRIVARPIEMAAQAAAGLAQEHGVDLVRSHVIEANHLVAALHRTGLEVTKAHEQQRLLREELSHRVKNLLTVVIAMTMRTLSSEHAKDERELLIRRLQALGRSHDLLTANRWEGASLAQIVEAELSEFAGRIEAGGPDINLDARATQTITMILHELATNAVKYGALSSPHGRVTLAWSLEREETPRFSLTWRESGGPPVRPPERQGFGTSLLGSALREGTAHIEFRREGLVYELTAPLAEVTTTLCAPPANDGGSRPVMRIAPGADEEAIGPRSAAG
jgi:two-component sensor histidine kinase